MKRLSLVLCVLALVLVAGCVMAGDKVLLISSYHAEYPWVIEEMEGVDSVFRDKQMIEVEKFYLDTKRRTSEAWKKKAAQEAAKRIDEFKPDLVIVFDDNACELVARHYIGTALPFVFCGMNGEPKDYGFPAPNITGVIERHKVGESIELLKRLVPGIKTAALVSDDSPTSRNFVTRTRGIVLPIDMVEFYATDDFGAWKAKIEELQQKVDALGIATYQTLKEGGGEVSLPAEDVLKWTLEHNQIPEFTFFDFGIEEGVLCGVIVSGYEQGKAAAEIGLMILAGASPGNIRIRNPQKGIAMINEKRAKQLHLVIPEDMRQDVTIVR